MLSTNLKTRCSGDGPNQNKCFDELRGAVQFSNGYSGYGFNTLETASRKPDQEECLNGLLSSVQYSGCVDNEHVLSSAFKTLNTSSERGQLNHCCGHVDPAWFSSGDDSHFLSTDLNARGSAWADSVERQFRRHTGFMQPSGNTETKKGSPQAQTTSRDWSAVTELRRARNLLIRQVQPAILAALMSKCFRPKHWATPMQLASLRS